MDSSTKVDNYLYENEDSRKITRGIEFIVFGFISLMVFILTARIMSILTPIAAQRSAFVFRVIFWLNLFLIIIVVMRFIITKKLAAYTTLFLILTFLYILYIIVDMIAENLNPDTASYAWYFFIIDITLFFFIMGAIFDKVDYLRDKLKILKAGTISLFVMLMKMTAQVIKIIPNLRGNIIDPAVIVQQQLVLLWIFIFFTLIFGFYSIFTKKEGKTSK